MGFKKGNKYGRGRPKGSKNKFTTLKESFIEAYLKLGGTKALIKWIEASPKNKAAFYHDLIRLIPTSQLTAIEKDRVTYELSEKFMPGLSMKDLKESLGGYHKLKIERIITDKNPQPVMRMPRPEDEQPESKPKPEEDRIIDIESLSTAEIEAEIKTLKSKKREIEASNKASKVKVH